MKKQNALYKDGRTDTEALKTMARRSKLQQKEQYGGVDEREFYAQLEKEWKKQDSRHEQENESVLSNMFWLPVLMGVRAFTFWISIIMSPLTWFLRTAFGININSVSFWDVSLSRRKETLAVAFFVALIPLCGVAYIVAFFFLIFPLTTLPTLAYLIYVFKWDDSHETGKRYPFLRFWKIWKYYADYFPCRLVKTCDLDPKEKYVFCYHPHGIISVGAFGNFGTDGTGFSKKFPGIDLRLLTLNLNFYTPWLREILIHMGICSASKRSCNQILKKGPGSAIMLVVGGAAESLDAAPGTYRLTLNRQGFVRVAIDNDAHLIPVLGFGETDIFDVYTSPPGSRLRRIQDYFKRKMGFAVPIFTGRGMFNYSFGWLPHRKPIYAVVGKPVKVRGPPHLKGSKLYTTDEGRALVNKYHKEYIQALTSLYDQFKNKWAQNRTESLMVNGTHFSQIEFDRLQAKSQKIPPTAKLPDPTKLPTSAKIVEEEKEDDISNGTEDSSKTDSEILAKKSSTEPSSLDSATKKPIENAIEKNLAEEDFGDAVSE